MDHCTWFPETWYKGFSRKRVSIVECCKGHDDTCSTRKFYLCLKDKIGRFHATYIGLGGSIGCIVKYPAHMIRYWKEKYKRK